MSESDTLMDAAIGGAVAGYLQGGDTRNGAVVGALVTVGSGALGGVVGAYTGRQKP